MSLEDRKSWEQFMAAALASLRNNGASHNLSLDELTHGAAAIADHALAKLKERFK